MKRGFDGDNMKAILAAAFSAGLILAASSISASAQGFSAVTLLMHSSVVSYCEGRELSQKEAQGTAIGWSSMWQSMRDCQTNRAKREATQAAKKK
jgi:hypothetical protein